MGKSSPLSEEDRADLVAYLDGELDTETARALENKLHLNPKARAEAEALRRTWSILDYLPRPHTSATFASRTMERVSLAHPVTRVTKGRNGWRQPWTVGVGWIAAVLLAGTVGFAGVSVFSNRSHPPPPAPAPVQASMPTDLDRLLVRDLRVIENKRLYDFVDDTNFLNLLDDPDLFGDGS